jgi:hypothetical protein
MPEVPKPLKQVKFATLFDDGTILLKQLVLSYPHVFKLNVQTITDKKTGVTKTTKSYGCVGLLPKKTHVEAKNLCVHRIREILAESNKGVNIPADRKFIRDGDPVPDVDGEVGAGKPEELGHWVVSAREQEGRRPITRDRYTDPKTGKARILSPDNPEDVARIYGGCIGNMIIRPWWQDSSEYGKRVNCGLVAVQFWADGTPFGKGRITEEVVDDLFEAEPLGETADDEVPDFAL